MGMTAADGTIVSLDRTELQPHACKDIRIGIVHLLIRFIHARDIFIKRVKIFHDEFPAAHEAKARTPLITEFILNLIEHQGQLLVRAYFVAYKSRNHLLMRRSQAEVTAMAILDAHHLIAIGTPAAAFFPEFRRLQDWHHDFLATGCIHLLADDLLDLADCTPGQRQKSIHAAGRFADHPGTVHELMAGNFCLSRRISKGWCVKITCSHSCVPPILHRFL